MRCSIAIGTCQGWWLLIQFLETAVLYVTAYEDLMDLAGGTDPELKQWSNLRAAVRGEVGVHQQKREWIWGPCVT